MAGKKNTTYPIGIVSGVFAVAMIMVKDNCTQNKLQILSGLNPTYSYAQYGLKKLLQHIQQALF